MAKRSRPRPAQEPVEPQVDPKAERKARGKEKRAKKKEAIKLLLAFVKNNTTEEELLSAAVLLTPGQRFGGVVRTGRIDVIAAAFIDSLEIHEDNIWADYKLGRSELRKICVNLIKKRAPVDRLWISFDAESGIYHLDGTGESAPEGWVGYQPVDMDDLDI